MPKKKYNSEEALGKNLDYDGIVSGLPAEMQPMMEEAIVASINIIHGGHEQDGGASEAIIEQVANAEDKGGEIAKAALSIVDMLEEQMEVEESVKLLVGFVITKELADLVNSVLDAKISEDELSDIYETALTVYLHEQVASKPTREERDAEAVRIQKEIDPLVPPNLKQQQQQQQQPEGV